MKKSFLLTASISAAAIACVASVSTTAQSSTDPGSREFDRTQVLTLNSVSGASQTGSEFGFALAAGGRSLMIGAPDLSVDGVPAGGVFHLVAGQTMLTVTGSLAPITQASPGISGAPERGDRFGHSIAALRPYDNGMTCSDWITGSSDVETYCWEYAVGAPREDIGDISDAGMVNILRIHSEAKDRTLRFIHQGVRGIKGALEPNDRFGSTLVSGDFDGDGADDLAIGVHGEDIKNDNDAGMVNVVMADRLNFTDGTRNGLTANGDDALSEAAGINTIGVDPARTSDWFGYALAAGDFNGDGVTDLAVGEPNGAPPRRLSSIFTPRFKRGGHAHVYLGSDGSFVNGFDTKVSNITGQHQVSFATPEDGDLYGAAMVAGDFNGDGVDDLVVGAPGEAVGRTRAGMIMIHYGVSKTNLGALERVPAAGELIDSIENAFSGSTRGPVHGMHQGICGISGANEDGDMFGAALGAGDLDGDGFEDLIVGIPGEDLNHQGTDYVDAGRIVIIYGSDNGLKTCDSDENSLVKSIDERAMGRVQRGQRFGFSIATGLFNDGPALDLAVGNGSNINPNSSDLPYSQAPHVAGRVTVFYND